MVKPKKYLGQHFLTDNNIAAKIANSLINQNSGLVVEIGPGTGILTQQLIKRNFELILIEIDSESVEYLKENLPANNIKILNKDFLKIDVFNEISKKDFCLIGNLPYNISSQIFFKVLEYRTLVSEMVCMIQKEVAERIVSHAGSKVYGILSVLIQLFYKTEYLFTVSEKVFFPQPKVKSAVIRLTRYRDNIVDVDFNNLFEIVKLSFNQRRKTLRNSLKNILLSQNENIDLTHSYFDKRAEQLSPEDFVKLTKMIYSKK